MYLSQFFLDLKEYYRLFI